MLDEVQNAPGWEVVVRRMTESGRKLDVLTEAMEEQKLDVGLVLTESEHDDIVSGPRILKVRSSPPPARPTRIRT